MKKILCALLILSLIFCATALAEGTYDQDDKTATTTLTTTIKGPDAPSYTVVIPSTLAITPNTTSTPLTVRLVEAKNAKSVTVTAEANGSMTNGSGGTINFTVDSTTLTFSNFNSLPSEKWMSIHITEAEWQQAPAGNYTGALTFTISAE
mgnify:FL=1